MKKFVITVLLAALVLAGVLPLFNIRNAMAEASVPGLPEAPDGRNDLTPIYNDEGLQIYPLFPDKETFGQEQIIFTVDIPAELQDEVCEDLDNPYIDPATWGDMDDTDNHARLDVVYCNGTYFFRAWSVWAGRPPMIGEWNLQRLVLDWQLTNLTDNVIYDSGHLETVEDPVEEGGPAVVEGQVVLPVSGKTYRMHVIAYTRQLGCDNGSGQVEFIATQVAPVGQIDVLKTDQNDNPVSDVTMEMWFRNKVGEWELGSVKQTDVAGQVSFAAPQGNYKIAERLETLPPMSHPVSPATGETEEFLVDPEHQVVLVEFVNFVPKVIYLPLIQKSGPPEVCTRSAQISYVDRAGLYQSVIRKFTSTGAEVFSVGVLPYARVLSISMTDGNPVELMTIQSVTADGGRYTYTDDQGPVWKYAGTWDWDKDILPADVTWLRVVDIHNAIAEYHEGDELCVLNVQAQWDPPELQQLQEQLAGGTLTPAAFYEAAAVLSEK